MVTFYRVPYDIPQAQGRILAANLPERLATRLALGENRQLAVFVQLLHPDLQASN